MIEVEPSVRLEVLDWGGSGRPLVFVPCYFTGHAFDDIGPKLIDQFHALAFTRRGIGASSQPPVGYELQRSADDLLAVLDALGLQSPVLAASSCGGKTVTLLAEQHPRRLGALVLLEAAEDPTLTLADYKLPAFDEASLPERVARPALDDSSVEAYRRTQKARSGVAFPEAEVHYQFAVKEDGSLGRSLWAADVRAGVPAAKIVEMPGASVFMFLSHEAGVIREIRAFAATLR